MAAVDPYSPCPCGSGQKFKWCCHKVEAQAERAQRLFENGQVDAAVRAVDEGLQKESANPWLLVRKAMYLMRLERFDEAKTALRLVTQRNPKHYGALALLTRLTLATEGPVAGASMLQQAITAVPTEERTAIAPTAHLVGVAFSRAGLYPAALRHLALVTSLIGDDDRVTSVVRSMERDDAVSPWLKNSYTLEAPPAGLSASQRDQFDRALTWAEEGLWSSASSAFEVLASSPAASPQADLNAGFCRLWIGDEAGAAEALRRGIARLGVTPEAVDLEALCQQIAPPGPDDVVEEVQLIWPLRDREVLLTALRADSSVVDDDERPIDPNDPESLEVEAFGLLDRPALPEKAVGPIKVEDLPRFVGHVLIGQEIVALETFDDGRLDGLAERFTSLARGAIPPAHPKTKVLGKVHRTELALTWEWHTPEGLTDDDHAQLQGAQRAWLLRNVWPNTPLPYLNGKTPVEAAKAGNASVALRAALSVIEQANAKQRIPVEVEELRRSLRIEPEPAIDPETVDIDRLHLSRLRLVPVDRLNDDRLVAIHRRARRYTLTDTLEHASRALVERPDLWERAHLNPLILYSELAMIAASSGRTSEASDWFRRGRQADPAEKRADHAPQWDMMELRTRAISERAEVWVPELAAVMERYGNDRQANEVIVMTLLDLGLIRMLPNPDRPDDLLLDSRPLEMLMAEYGPRITTASGQLGVSATKGALWTPGSPSGSAGGLWTPGSEAGGASGGGEKPKLIIPGR